MRHVLHLLLVSGLIVTLLACKKRDETAVNEICPGKCVIVKVQVGTDLNGKSPLNGANVELSWSNIKYSSGDAGRLIATGTTAADGSLTFSFKAEDKELKGGNYSIIVRKGGEYFDFFKSFTTKNPDTTINFNAQVSSKATVKIIYKNFNPKISTDFFECLPYFKNGNFTSSGPIRLYKADGQDGRGYFYATEPGFSLLELSGTTAGNEYTYFTILKKSNGGRIDLLDSIYINKGETKTYVVDYQ